MVESGPAEMTKAATKASTTVRASRFCARVDEWLDRMKFCSSERPAGIVTIGASLRAGLNWRCEPHIAGPVSSQAVCLSSPPFCSLGRRVTTGKGLPDHGRFGPLFERRGANRSHWCGPGPIGQIACDRSEALYERLVGSRKFARVMSAYGPIPEEPISVKNVRSLG